MVESSGCAESEHSTSFAVQSILVGSEQLKFEFSLRLALVDPLGPIPTIHHLLAFQAFDEQCGLNATFSFPDRPFVAAGCRDGCGRSNRFDEATRIMPHTSAADRSEICSTLTNIRMTDMYAHLLKGFCCRIDLCSNRIILAVHTRILRQPLNGIHQI